MQNQSSLSFRIVEFIFRIIGLIFGSIWGWQLGGWALELFGTPAPQELLVAGVYPSSQDVKPAGRW